MREIAKNLSLRLSEEEYGQLQAKAKARGLKLEPAVRCLIAEAKIESGRQAVCKDMLCKLSSIGKQINQIACQANSQKRITDPELRRATALVQEAYTLIESSL